MAWQWCRPPIYGGRSADVPQVPSVTMRRWRTLLFVRSTALGSLQETFLVAGVTTVLVIRTQLWLTNYPQLGGHRPPIPPLPWGRLFLTIAIGLSLTFLGRAIRPLVALVGGV